jgi:hypothetical protein
MIAVRNNRKTEGMGWRLLRWFTLPLVLLALGISGNPKAEAHPVQVHFQHSVAGAVSDVAPDSRECCDEADHSHTTGSCSNFGHCAACAAGNAGVSTPDFSAEGCFGLPLIILPAGLSCGPAEHPPKAS